MLHMQVNASTASSTTSASPKTDSQQAGKPGLFSKMLGQTENPDTSSPDSVGQTEQPIDATSPFAASNPLLAQLIANNTDQTETAGSDKAVKPTAATDGLDQNPPTATVAALVDKSGETKDQSEASDELKTAALNTTSKTKTAPLPSLVSPKETAATPSEAEPINGSETNKDTEADLPIVHHSELPLAGEQAAPTNVDSASSTDATAAPASPSSSVNTQDLPKTGQVDPALRQAAQLPVEPDAGIPSSGSQSSASSDANPASAVPKTQTSPASPAALPSTQAATADGHTPPAPNTAGEQIKSANTISPTASPTADEASTGDVPVTKPVKADGQSSELKAHEGPMSPTSGGGKEETAKAGSLNATPDKPAISGAGATIVSSDTAKTKAEPTPAANGVLEPTPLNRASNPVQADPQRDNTPASGKADRAEQRTSLANPKVETGAEPQAKPSAATNSGRSSEQIPSLFQANEAAAQASTKINDTAALPVSLTATGEVARTAGTVSIPMASQTTASSPQVPLNNLAVHIASQANAGNQRFDIRLDPPELGRIDIRLEISRDGQTMTHLAVEKPETLDLLRQDSRQLERALTNAGLDSREGNVSFSLQEENRNRQQAKLNDEADASLEDGAAETEDQEESGHQQTVQASSGIDISI